MSSGSKVSPKLNGTNLVQAFLGELSGYLYGVPGNTLSGTPREIVRDVIANTDRFSNCDEECIANLERQLLMAVNGQHGQRFRLSGRTVGHGLIEVKVV